LLRSHFPEAKICWFAQPPGAKLLKHIAGIDQIVPVHLKTNGTRNKWKEIRRVLSSHCRDFDIVLDFQGLLKSAVFARLLRGKTLGFDKKNLKEPLARLLYSQKAPLFDESQHVIYKNLHLARQLLPNQTGETSSPPVEYPLAPSEPAPNVRAFMAKHQLREKKFFVLNVGGGWESKIMSPQQHIQIINKIKSLAPVTILWGNEKEKEIAAEVAQETGAILTPFWDFHELIDFIRRACVTVTGDTLALHISDMVETPSVGIFGPTSPFRNGSLLPHSVHVYENLHCSFCYKKTCGTIDCIKQINIDKIIEAIKLLHEKSN
jgi:ADP-heptose:LPS heptosyltransferase